MKCYKCQSENKVKAGFTRGLQRYKCKDCGCFFSVEQKSDVKSTEQKRLALEMYLEGMGFRAIGRVLKISYGTVYQWVKKWGESVSLPKSEEPIEIVELDEIHSYVQNKKTTAGAGCCFVLKCHISLWWLGEGGELRNRLFSVKDKISCEI